MMKSTFALLIIALFILPDTHAQLDPVKYNKIDSLFIEWNQPNHPGGVVGIMQNENTVFLKAYGLASLEYLVPNSTGTIFNTASVSKQFTAMGIVMLHLQGKLSVDDDIRKYIPELPDFGETITIRHMLHHTSGLRSLHGLLGMAGWRSDDVRTNKDLYRFMENQNDLNFIPGDEYLYCNTGYMYMAKIIETVTEERFSVWMKNSIFEPLGMINTYVEDKYNRVVTQNATSYNISKPDAFERAVEFWDYVGSGNMHSNASDLLKWLSNFYDPEPEWEQRYKMLQTLDALNGGEKINYAFGINVGAFKGVKRIQHGGSIGGFRSNVATYPEQECSIVILTNFSSSSPAQKVDTIFNLLVNDIIRMPESKDSIKQIIQVDVSARKLKKYEGSYWNNIQNNYCRISLEDDTLRFYYSDKDYYPLLPISKTEFRIEGIPQERKIHFNLDEGDEKALILKNSVGKPQIYKSYEPFVPTRENLATYTGNYYSPELETYYKFSVENDTLTCHHNRHGDLKMKCIKEDIFEGRYPIGTAKFNRDSSGLIYGMSLSNGRVRNLWFNKQE